jgi:hypothetical protein
LNEKNQNYFFSHLIALDIRNGRVLPVEASDFRQKSAIFLPEEARYDYLLNLPDDADCGKAVNYSDEYCYRLNRRYLGSDIEVLSRKSP